MCTVARKFPIIIPQEGQGLTKAAMPGSQYDMTNSTKGRRGVGRPSHIGSRARAGRGWAWTAAERALGEASRMRTARRIERGRGMEEMYRMR